MSSRIHIFRHVMLNLRSKPCRVTSLSTFGARKELPHLVSSRNIITYQKLQSTATANKFTPSTPWKPLSDPQANKELLQRSALIASLVVALAGSYIYFLYLTNFSPHPDPKNVIEYRKRHSR